MAPLRGALIVIEGLDRSGKSTQVARLVKNLIEKGIRAEAWNFPDRTTALGQVINSYLKNSAELDDHAIHLLFSANRWEKRAALLTKINEGTTLVIDRYSFSGVAFSAAKSGMSAAWCRQPEVGLPKPDAVCFLSADAEILKARGGFGDERYEKEEFQKVVAKRFHELKDDTWVEIDASETPDRVAERLLDIAIKTIQSVPVAIGQLWV